jgi:hypothetical protein
MISIGKKKRILKKKESKSFDDMSAESRKESGEVLLSIDARAGSEATEIIDSFETGEVSEVAGEDKKKKAEPGVRRKDSSSPQRDDQVITDIEEVEIPSQKVMIRKVRLAIQKEIEEKRREIRILEKHPTKKAFELSLAVEVLRKLYGMLQEISFKSSEFIKNVWFDIFQGKKISDILQEKR